MGAPSSTSYQTDKRPIRIEILYFDGCPNFHDAHANVKMVVGELGIQAEVELIDVTTDEEALARKFLGSPSVRVEGTDVESLPNSQPEYSLCCRRYAVAGAMQGFPSKSMIALAIQKSLESHE